MPARCCTAGRENLPWRSIPARGRRPRHPAAEAGERERAISRGLGIPMVSAFGGGVLFFAFLASIGNCLD
jgi:hypothetical protein